MIGERKRVTPVWRGKAPLSTANGTISGDTSDTSVRSICPHNRATQPISPWGIALLLRTNEKVSKQQHHDFQTKETTHDTFTYPRSRLVVCVPTCWSASTFCTLGVHCVPLSTGLLRSCESRPAEYRLVLNQLQNSSRGTGAKPSSHQYICMCSRFSHFVPMYRLSSRDI